jgi:hypothetical protein
MSSVRKNYQIHDSNEPCSCGSGKKFKKCCINKGKECPGWDVDASEDGQSIIPCEHEECKTTNKKWRVHEIEDQEDLWY